MIEIKNGQLKISVRNLVEFLCREGNLDNRFRGVSDKNAMEAGSKAHRKIQKSMGPDYQSEVPLSETIPTDRYEIVVEGRADGIFANNGVTYIDEIKGTYGDVKYMSEAVAVHRAQAMCYAYMYANGKAQDNIGIRMTYVNLDTENVRYFEEILTIGEIKEWFDKLITELRKWGDYTYEHTAERNASIAGMKFPFEYREGQRELAVSVYKAINRERNLFIQAPTGVGKTISTVFPAVMSMGSGKGDRLFYLTAKTVTRTAAEEAFSIMREGGLKFKTVTITAKDKVCMLESETGPECNPITCPYAKGHFDRVNEAVYDLITHEDVVTREIIEQYALKHQVCPFEFCLDVTYWMDGIICDYNYVFDPHVKLKRFFADGVKGDNIFLVDEAHNLVDRAREMYSAEIYKDRFLEIKKLMNGYSKKLVNALDRCNRNLLAFKRDCPEDYMILESDGIFSANMSSLAEEIIKFTEANRDFPFMKELSEFYFEVMHYNDMHDRLDDNYMVYCEHTDNGFMLKLFCVNPAVNLSECIAKGLCGIFFSATLLPINYFKELISGNKEDYAIYAHSPFDVNRRLLMVGKDVTSRYTRRNETEYLKVCDYICKVTSGKKGNYLIFFPSYKYMQAVYDCFMSLGNPGDYDVVMQSSNMTEAEKEEFLRRFDAEDKDRILLGFCVMGGSFSEGIDLKNDRLIGTVIVGTGLPSIATTQQLLRKFYDDKENCGYEYAYIYPGMNKVLQAAGRVIRTEEDRGVIALLDDRFLSPQYLSLFPAEWSNYRVVTQKSAQEEVLDFWNNMIYNVMENVFK